MTQPRDVPPIVLDGDDFPPTPPVRGSVFSATLWTLGGEGAGHALRLLSSLALTRLLFPEAFGLMAVVQVFMAGLRMFSDLGLWSIIVRHERGEDASFLNTVWTVNVIRGALLTLAACAIAWPASKFYGQPDLAKLLPAASLNLFLEGFLSTKFFSCYRRLSQAGPTLINLVSSIAGIACMVAWAWAYRSVWALVWGGAAAVLIRVVLSHVALPGPGNRFQWDREAWREIAHFGQWIFLNSAVTFLALQLDKLVFAKLIPLWMLGVYAIAMNIVQLPTAALQSVASGVAFPAFSRDRQQIDELAALFDRTRQWLLLAGGAAISFLIFNGPWLMALLYDPRYEDAGWILQVAAIGGWFLVLEASHGGMLLALGHPKWLTLASASKVLAMAVTVPLAYKAFKFPGALAAFSLVEAVRYLVESARVAKAGLKNRSHEKTMSVLVLTCAAAAILIQHGPWISGGLVLRGILSFSVFAAVWIPTGLWGLRKFRSAV